MLEVLVLVLVPTSDRHFTSASDLLALTVALAAYNNLRMAQCEYDI